MEKEEAKVLVDLITDYTNNILIKMLEQGIEDRVVKDLIVNEMRNFLNSSQNIIKCI